MPTLRKAWEVWKRIAAKIAHVQGHLLLSLVYVLIVAPTALLVRCLRHDPLEMRPHESPSFWTPREKPRPAEEFFKSQF